MFRTLLLCLAACVLTGTLMAQGGISPSEMVQSATTKKTTFKNYEPFTIATQTRSGNKLEQLSANDYTILNLDPHVLVRIAKEQAEAIELSIPSFYRNDLRLQLVKSELFSPDAQLRFPDGTTQPIQDAGVHYRGVIKGDENSLVSISVYNDQIMGVISGSDEGNIVLGRMDDNIKDEYILYNDKDVLRKEGIACDTPDDDVRYTREELMSSSSLRSAEKCLRLYLEVDYDVYLERGSISATTQFVSGLYNQVAAIFANEQIKAQLSEVFIWSSPSPYVGSSSQAMLEKFQENRSSFNGDLGQLVSFKASGGMAAGFNGLCASDASEAMCFSSIKNIENYLPEYSFSVMVMIHELGHLMGSRHTHACVWNGNMTALDGCAGYVEGGCGVPTMPENGGTLMSYCHLQEVGIKFSNGFGIQPRNILRNRISKASCLDNCDATAYDFDACNEQTLVLNLQLDNYGSETTWEIRDENNAVMYRGGPYANGTSNVPVVDTMCLPEGCYTFEIFDEYKDGICCKFGNGNYRLTDGRGNLYAEGGSFGASERHDICLPFEAEEAGVEASCVYIDMGNETVRSYGVSQDNGSSSVQAGTTLKLKDNAWKAIHGEYKVGPNTLLVFEFGATEEGEVHGIGLDTDDIPSSDFAFQLFGTQEWGNTDFNDYPGDARWKTYSIPVGEYFTGDFTRLFFVMDNDEHPEHGTSFYRNIRLIEKGACEEEGLQLINNDPINDLEAETDITLETDLPATPFRVQTYPNPATDQVQVAFNTDTATNTAALTLLDMNGRVVRQQNTPLYTGYNELTMNVQDVAAGTYVLRIQSGEQLAVQKLMVSRR